MKRIPKISQAVIDTKNNVALAKGSDESNSFVERMSEEQPAIYKMCERLASGHEALSQDVPLGAGIITGMVAMYELIEAQMEVNELNDGWSN